MNDDLVEFCQMRMEIRMYDVVISTNLIIEDKYSDFVAGTELK